MDAELQMVTKCLNIRQKNHGVFGRKSLNLTNPSTKIKNCILMC